jgi:hypothetical protein
MPIWRARAIAAVNPPDHFTRERMRDLPVVSPPKSKERLSHGQGNSVVAARHSDPDHHSVAAVLALMPARSAWTKATGML